MTTALELLKHTNTAIAKHRNLSHGPQAHQSFQLNRNTLACQEPFHISAQTSGTLISFILCSELKEVCIQSMQTPFTMGDGPQMGNPLPHPYPNANTHSVLRGEGEEASQFSRPQPEALRGGRGSLRPWLPLDPTRRQT